jgi:hypothetical protein
MTDEEFEIECARMCPSCAGGSPVRKRADTGEWVHDARAGSKAFAHHLCGAHELRKRRG